MAYHAGALKALDEQGLAVGNSDVIVGTSAGSIIGSLLASGWAASDFYEHAQGRHRDSITDPRLQKEEVGELFTRLYSNRIDRTRRQIGGLFAAGASRGLWRGPRPPAPLRRLFPSGLYSTDRSRERLAVELPHTWPDRDLYVCAVELYTGKRVAFGHPGAPKARLPEAVLASTAIPAMFPPVRIAGKSYLDGGAYSATSLDLAVEAGCDHILCVAPLGYMREKRTAWDPRSIGPRLIRNWFSKSLKQEVIAARAKGIHVLVVRPWMGDLRDHGANSMRFFDRAALAESSRIGTKRLLDLQDDHPVIKAFTPSPKAKKKESSHPRRAREQNRSAG